MDTAGGFLQTKASSNRAKPLCQQAACQAILPIKEEKWKCSEESEENIRQRRRDNLVQLPDG